MAFAFDEKAHENLEAAKRLLPDEDGLRECLPNAATSRAYYAAYLAVTHRARAEGIPFTTQRNFYRHDALPDDALSWRILDEEQRDDLSFLYHGRVKADYWPDHVDFEEADVAVSLAERLVSDVLGAA